jgi:HK97 family phage portal protein
MRLGNLEIKLNKREDAPLSGLAQKTVDFLSGADLNTGSMNAGSYVDEKTALNISAVQACVRVLSEDIAMLPIKVYKTVKNGKEEDTSHPLYQILKNKPNEWMSSYVFTRLLMQHLLLYGNFYCEIMYKRGEIVGLLPIHPSLVTMKSTPNGKYFYEVKVKNEKKPLQWYYVMHVLGMSDDGINGLSPIEMARKSLGLSLAVDQFGSNFFGQGTNMGMTLEHPGKLSEPARENLKKSIDEKNGGLTNSHRVFILEEGMKSVKNVIPPNDSQFLETRKYQKEDIATLFRVPLHLIQSLDKATNNNIEHQSLDYVIHSLLPWIKNIEQAMINSLFIYYPDTFPEFTVDALLRGDFKTRMEGYNLGIGNGMYSINECRAKENMNPIENGDEHYIMVNNMAPINTVGQEKTQAQKSQPKDDTPVEPLKVEKKSVEIATETRQDSTYVLKSLELRKKDGLLRNSIRDSYMPVFDAVVLEIIKREKADIMRCVEKKIQSKKPKEEILRGCIVEFYNSHLDYIKNKLSAPVKGLSRAINDAASSEIDGNGLSEERMQEFIDDFLQGYSDKFKERSRGQLQQILEDSEYDGIEDALSTRFEEWANTRPGKTSLELVVQLAEAVATSVFFSNLRKAEWSTTSEKPCPICEELNGKIIVEGETFVKAGDQILDLQVYQDKTHPPLHGGCACVIIPA